MPNPAKTLRSPNAYEFALRVIVRKSANGNYWTAQGIDIDFSATGVDETSARENFERSFVATVRAMVAKQGDVGALYSRSKTPDSYLRELASGAKHDIFSCVVQFELPSDFPDELPSRIDFLRADDSACMAAHH